MRQVSLLISLLIAGCSNLKQADEQTVSETVGLRTESVQLNSTDEAEERRELTDTTSNGVKIRILELSVKSFDSLQSFGRRTEIPLKSFDSRIIKLDSCKTFKLDNGRIDSLCNMDDGEYYEKYVINGLWEEKNLLLTSF